MTEAAGDAFVRFLTEEHDETIKEIKATWAKYSLDLPRFTNRDNVEQRWPNAGPDSLKALAPAFFSAPIGPEDFVDDVEWVVVFTRKPVYHPLDHLRFLGWAVYGAMHGKSVQVAGPAVEEQD